MCAILSYEEHMSGTHKRSTVLVDTYAIFIDIFWKSPLPFITLWRFSGRIFTLGNMPLNTKTTITDADQYKVFLH